MATITVQEDTLTILSDAKKLFVEHKYPEGEIHETERLIEKVRYALTKEKKEA